MLVLLAKGKGEPLIINLSVHVMYVCAYDSVTNGIKVIAVLNNKADSEYC